jgi:2-phospho-L-lactate transferase/gluconeogenesis factor (CofD/UPF0052 family)
MMSPSLRPSDDFRARWKPGSPRTRLRVVLFSGGRGSGALAQALVGHPSVDLTLAINGYDDGASTGEVRRFLGDSLGPSDFRKNASRLAIALKTCAPELVAVLDARLPVGCQEAEADRWFAAIAHADGGVTATESGARFAASAAAVDPEARQAVVDRLEAFSRERARLGRAFELSDCSIGNLVFAGSFLLANRDFNRAVEDYCALLGLPEGLLQNVTDGTNAFLVALDLQGHLLGSEEEIVDAKRQNRIQDIFLIDRPVGAEECRRIEEDGPAAVAAFLDTHARAVGANPLLLERIAAADLIVYAPGTQHSSLFPSYLTPGLSRAIARNLTAIKLLITNIQADAEITDSRAIDLMQRAAYYLKEKGRLHVPTPCLITHYLINDPGATPGDAYVRPGPLDTVADPRPLRIANYEAGMSGRHDAAKVLGPFVDSLLRHEPMLRVAIVLHDAESLDKVSQTILEMTRGGLRDVLPQPIIGYVAADELDEAFVEELPFAARRLAAHPQDLGTALRTLIADERLDYVVLFESSGMYRGEDIVALASYLAVGRLDVVWGSRRLSVRDVEASLRLRYKHRAGLRLLSVVGSHLLSLASLVLYGRYMSDTLSAARVVRASYLLDPAIDPAAKAVNYQILSAVLRDKAEILEIPVEFLPISPDRVKRTTVADGLSALWTLVRGRLRRRRPSSGSASRVLAEEEWATGGKVS